MTKPTVNVKILACDGQILMPTKRFGHVRRLLDSGRAKVVSRCPFQIQLLYPTTTYTQNTWLLVDAGYKHIGLSVQTEKEELFSAEAELLTSQSQRLDDCRMYQTQRRSRLRHRAPRFDNRKRKEDWLAPSIQHKYDSHLRLIETVKRYVPVKYTIIETATFDIQQLKHPGIAGTDYQNGEQANSYNLREYILHRDGYECQSPKCVAKRQTGQQQTNIPLQVHHLGYWKGDGSNRPANLITLCIKCHTSPNHQKGKLLWGWEPKVRSFRPETFMSTVAKRLVKQLDATETFGYLTKTNRIALGLSKTHANDAFAIRGRADMPRAVTYKIVQRRRNNRSLETWKDAKYVDLRTGQAVNAQELNNGRRQRNKNLNTENLRPYRGKKVRAGKRSIRRHHYPLQPGDLVQVGTQRYTAIGTHNKGTRLMLKTPTNPISVNLNTVSLVKSGRGFSFQILAGQSASAENSSLA